MSLWKQCHIAGIPVTVASTASSIGGRGLVIGPYYVGSVYYRDGTTLRNRRLAWSPMLNLRDGTLAIWKVVQGWKSVASYLLRRYRESVVLYRAEIRGAVIKALASFSHLAEFGRQRPDKILWSTQHIMKGHVVEMHP